MEGNQREESSDNGLFKTCLEEKGGREAKGRGKSEKGRKKKSLLSHRIFEVTGRITGQHHTERKEGGGGTGGLWAPSHNLSGLSGPEEERKLGKRMETQGRLYDAP